MASSQPQGPPRPRPGFPPGTSPSSAAPPPNPNYLNAPMQNLQIGGGPRGQTPPPFSRPPFPSNGPIPSQSPQIGPPPAAGPTRPPFTGAAPPSRPPFSRGPPQRPPLSGSSPAPAQPPPLSVPPPVRPAPFSVAAPSQTLPFSGAPPSRPTPFSAPPSVAGARVPPFSGPPAVAGAQVPPFSGPPSVAGAPVPPFSGPPSIAGAPVPPFSGPPSAAQAQVPPFSGPPSVPAAQGPPFPPSFQPPSAAPRGMQPPFARPGPAFPGSAPPSIPMQPFSTTMQTPQPPPFPGAAVGSQGFPGAAPPPGGPYGSPPWSSQVPPGAPSITGSMQAPPGMCGIPTHAPHVPHVMGQSPSSKIDPNQIPRPTQSSLEQFETRQDGQANIPPPSTNDFIARDCGNCSPRYMRCTIHQIPCTGDLLSTASMSLALLVQPLALPHQSEEPIQVVDFGESGPLRCSRCKGYINPFMKFIDHGRRFICNLCGFTDETPRDYQCNLGPDGRRRDADERPELCRGTVEFVATKEYMVREPMPAVFFFLIDVSMNAVHTGATAAACSAIRQAITELPEGPRTMVGIATFDSTIHFYNLKRSSQQPLMLIVPDIEDVYTPLQSDLIVKLTECQEQLEQLLDSIPTLFENNKVAESAFGAAMKASFLAMKSNGGKLLVFQSVLPSAGVGSLLAREAEGRTNISSGDKEAQKLLQPADKTLKEMAIEFAEFQVCVDIFITTQSYVDFASISVVPRTTGGQVYYYYPFSAVSDSAKLFNDLRWNLTRPQGLEAVMRVRCSQGLQVQDYYGNFCKRIPTDIDLPGIDCDKTVMVTFKHDDKFQEGSECSLQCALLYTTVYGQRRIRISTLSLPCTSTLSNLFRSADLDAQFACFAKQAANSIPITPLSQVRDQITNLCVNILHAYRKYCATVSSAGQLILPEALKLLPLYTLALIKSIGLRTDGRLDDRSYWVGRAVTLSTALSIPLVFPRMITIHDLLSKESGDTHLIPQTTPLSSEHVKDEGIYLLENGEDGLVYVGNSVDPDLLDQIFGVSSIDAIPTQLSLQQYDNELSKKLNDVLNEIRRQRCSYLRLRLCRKGEPSGMLFFSYMIEDKTPGGLSYVEFLVHLHRQIQIKMA